MMSEVEKQALIAGALASKPRWPKVTRGEPTGLQCQHCRGVLHMRVVGTEDIFKGPPRSRNRRIRKKQLKRWLEENRLMLAVHGFMTAQPRGGYICGTCNRSSGFYQAIARNIFLIEPLPPGALPIYDRDIDVASIDTGDE